MSMTASLFLQPRAHNRQPEVDVSWCRHVMSVRGFLSRDGEDRLRLQSFL